LVVGVCWNNGVDTTDDEEAPAPVDVVTITKQQ
jgi:hypothetical protein